MTRKDFFKKHINIIKKKKLCCEECNDRLIGDVSEIAHILEKSYFKSVEFEDSNILYLCSWKSTNNCHGKFDNSSTTTLKNMNVFNKAQQQVEELLNLVKEKINYKILDKWQL